jgi:D-hexose-6-phosphate mutarotase
MDIDMLQKQIQLEESISLLKKSMVIMQSMSMIQQNMPMLMEQMHAFMTEMCTLTKQMQEHMTQMCTKALETKIHVQDIANIQANARNQLFVDTQKQGELEIEQITTRINNRIQMQNWREK